MLLAMSVWYTWIHQDYLWVEKLNNKNMMMTTTTATATIPRKKIQEEILK